MYFFLNHVSTTNQIPFTSTDMGVRAEMSETLQIKQKLSAWLDTTSDNG